jgi:hypothetical protein
MGARTRLTAQRAPIAISDSPQLDRSEPDQQRSLASLIYE